MVVLFQRRSRPYLPVGWFWYLGMLVPVIGIIKVGGQAYADRYTYLPQIGLIIALVWFLADWSGVQRLRRLILTALCVLVLGLLTITAHHQTTFWRDSLTLWSHAIASADESDLVLNNLGVVEMLEGKTEEAEAHFRRAIAINSAQVDARSNLGLALLKKGKKEEAISQYREAVKHAPQSTKILIRFANALAAMDRSEETIQHYREIVRRLPESAELRSNLGIELFRAGREQEGIHELDKAYAMEPKSVLIQNNLSYALATAHEDALLDGERALQLATQVDQSTGGEVPAFLETLAAAQAATGDFTKALKTVRRALDLAEASGDKEICTTLRKEITLYEQGIPLRDPR
jgi:tetratricopeptide (TPR) repeat protein